MRDNPLPGIADVGIRLLEKIVCLFLARCVYPQKDEQQNGESPQRGASIAEKRQRNADYGCESQHHTYVDEQVEEENPQYTIAVHSAEACFLAFR